jgi:MFS transporter, Spinster family, sphingosine-1-phosphate transporter
MLGLQGGGFNLNNFEDGVLSSAFMVGLLVASPIFASLAKMLVLCNLLFNIL